MFNKEVKKKEKKDDLHESVPLDVMDMCGAQNLSYLNASHQINWGWRVMNSVINLVYPIVIQRNIIVITVIRTITVITVECIALHW